MVTSNGCRAVQALLRPGRPIELFLYPFESTGMVLLETEIPDSIIPLSLPVILIQRLRSHNIQRNLKRKNLASDGAKVTPR